MTQDASVPLDPSPAPAAPPNLLLWVVSGILSLLLWLAVVGQLVFFVPAFARLSGEYGLKVPLVTEWILHNARWAVPASAIAALLVCIGMGRRSIWPWIFLLFLLPLAINGLVGASLYFTYMELLDWLGGGSKK